MKRILAILKQIHQWPENARTILAGLSFIISALLVFGIWNMNLTSRLSVLTPAEVANEEKEEGSETKVGEAEKVFSPIEGIGESLLYLGAILPEPPIDKETLVNEVTKFFSRISAGVTKHFNRK